MDPRTKFREEVDNIKGAGASGLLLPDTAEPGIAYLASNGDDTKGTVGDRFRPFATAQAAITAAIVFTEGGDCILCGGKGSFGDMDVTGASSLTLLGVGKYVTYFGAITSSTPLNIYGNGKDNVTVGEIVFQAPNGAIGNNGTDGGVDTNGTDGEAGGDGGTFSDGFNTIIFSGLNGSGDAVILAGHGGSGGSGGYSSLGNTPGNGGKGGNAGAAVSFTCIDCIFQGYAVTEGSYGGSGGAGGNSTGNLSNGGNGGDAGNGSYGGQLTLIRTQVNGMECKGYNAGSPGSGGLGLANGSDGASGSDGSSGNVVTSFAQAGSDVSNGESTTYRASIIQGTWYP